MKKLPKPTVANAETLLNNAIARKKRSDYISILNANKEYIKERYINYETNFKALENIKGSNISLQDDKNAMHSMFTQSFKKNIKEVELKDVYEKCAGVCPFCGAGKLEEVDHYIPKELYPEFTIYPLNLIPICNKCNKKKGEKFLNTKKERKFINFYLDSVDTMDFLNIMIKYESKDIKNTTKVIYKADFPKITDVYLREIVERHYEELNLLERYAEAANDELSQLYSIYSNQDDYNEKEIKNAALRTVVGVKNGQLEKAGRNDWKYLLYDEVIKTGYINDLVKCICNEKAP